MDERVQAAAERLRQAGTLRRPCRSLSDLVGDDLVLALAVQRRVVALQAIAGAVRVGAKVARAPDAGSVDDALRIGVLLDEMKVPCGVRLATSQLLQPQVELKLACRLVRDLGPRPGELGLADLRDAVELSAALEVVDRRVATSGTPTVVDDICDNAGVGHFVVGTTSASADELTRLPGGPVAARLEVDGELTWRGAASVDAALEDLRMVAAAWSSSWDPLRPGEVVLTRAIGPTLPAVEGQHYSAYVAGLSSAAVGFVASARLVTKGGTR